MLSDRTPSTTGSLSLTSVPTLHAGGGQHRRFVIHIDERTGVVELHPADI